MRVLCITNRKRTGGWLAEAFAGDSAAQVQLEEVVGAQAGLTRLRDETFDAILVSHSPGELDALELTEGYRASGADEPIIILGIQSEQEMAALSYEAGADGYVCANTATTRNLIWVVARAIQRHQLIRENRRLALAEQQRLQREHDEAQRLIGQQRTLILGLEEIRRRDRHAPPIVPGETSRPSPPRDDREPPRAQRGDAPADHGPIRLPRELIDHYRELLRTYVIMGSGNLVAELSRLAELLVRAGVTARETMQLHVEVLEDLIHGLGSRSTRHVMTRADLLILEIMVHLAERYRACYLQRVHPPVQKLLPGFADPVQCRVLGLEAAP
jgi:DNA-binding response OmpR family regulator